MGIKPPIFSKILDTTFLFIYLVKMEGHMSTFKLINYEKKILKIYYYYYNRRSLSFFTIYSTFPFVGCGFPFRS